MNAMLSEFGAKELAHALSTLATLYPYCGVAHAIVTCAEIRDDIGSRVFWKKHPLSCLASCLTSILAGTILSRFLLSQPILGAFESNQFLCLSTMAWYLVFYSPSDVFYRLCRLRPVRLCLSIMRDMTRLDKIESGVVEGLRMYPNSAFVVVANGIIRGCGTVFIKVIARALRGVWTPESIELLRPSLATKTSAIAAIVLFVQRNWSSMIPWSRDMVYTALIAFYTAIQIASVVLTDFRDPFISFENSICYVFFGPIDENVAKSKKNKSE